MICTRCGNIGKTKTAIKGTIITELFLWMCFLLPGIIYSIWRLNSRHQACKACGSDQIIPEDSPIAQQFKISKSA